MVRSWRGTITLNEQLWGRAEKKSEYSCQRARGYSRRRFPFPQPARKKSIDFVQAAAQGVPKRISVFSVSVPDQNLARSNCAIHRLAHKARRYGVRWFCGERHNWNRRGALRETNRSDARACKEIRIEHPVGTSASGASGNRHARKLCGPNTL